METKKKIISFKAIVITVLVVAVIFFLCCSGYIDGGDFPTNWFDDFTGNWYDD
jgi:hypothetical protein